MWEGIWREREYEAGGIWSGMRECGGEGNIEGEGIRVILNMERDEEYGRGWGLWKGMGNMEENREIWRRWEGHMEGDGGYGKGWGIWKR
jgi:hypothetical protein